MPKSSLNISFDTLDNSEGFGAPRRSTRVKPLPGAAIQAAGQAPSSMYSSLSSLSTRDVFDGIENNQPADLDTSFSTLNTSFRSLDILDNSEGFGAPCHGGWDLQSAAPRTANQSPTSDCTSMYTLNNSQGFGVVRRQAGFQPPATNRAASKLASSVNSSCWTLNNSQGFGARRHGARAQPTAAAGQQQAIGCGIPAVLSEYPWPDWTNVVLELSATVNEFSSNQGKQSRSVEYGGCRWRLFAICDKGKNYLFLQAVSGWDELIKKATITFDYRLKHSYNDGEKGIEKRNRKITGGQISLVTFDLWNGRSYNPYFGREKPETFRIKVGLRIYSIESN